MFYAVKVKLSLFDTIRIHVNYIFSIIYHLIYHTGVYVTNTNNVNTHAKHVLENQNLNLQGVITSEKNFPKDSSKTYSWEKIISEFPLR